MTDIAIGPFILAAARLPWILATLVLWAGAAIGQRKGYPALGHWSFRAALGGVITARVVFVVQHLGDYAAEPWTVLAFWQGGFTPWAAAIGFSAVSALYLRADKALVAWMAGATLAAGTILFITTQLLTAPDRQMPQDLTLSDMAGRPVSLEGPTVINLWASWCPPCRREMPMMIREAEANPALPIRFVNQGESAETIRRYLSRDNLVMSPVLDPAMALMADLEILGLPATLFIDAEGRIVAAHTGEMSRAVLRRNMADLARQ